MMTAERTFQMSSTAIQTESQMMAIANQLRSMTAASPPRDFRPAPASSAPDWVRKGSAEVQRDYALGLQFEADADPQLAAAR